MFHMKHFWKTIKMKTTETIDLVSKHFKFRPLRKEELDKLDSFAKILLEYADKINLISPTDKEKVFSRHILDALNAYPILDNLENFSLLDMGSGSGIPIIPLSILFPNSLFTAVEPREKRAGYLSIVKRKLNLKNLSVINSRVEDLDNSTKVDFVSCRALSDFDTDFKRAQKLIHSKGKFITFKSSVDDLPNSVKTISYKLPNENRCFYIVSAEFYD